MASYSVSCGGGADDEPFPKDAKKFQEEIFGDNLEVLVFAKVNNDKRRCVRVWSSKDTGARSVLFYWGERCRYFHIFGTSTIPGSWGAISSATRLLITTGSIQPQTKEFQRQRERLGAEPSDENTGPQVS